MFRGLRLTSAHGFEISLGNIEWSCLKNKQRNLFAHNPAGGIIFSKTVLLLILPQALEFSWQVLWANAIVTMYRSFTRRGKSEIFLFIFVFLPPWRQVYNNKYTHKVDLHLVLALSLWPEPLGPYIPIPTLPLFETVWGYFHCCSFKPL